MTDVSNFLSDYNFAPDGADCIPVGPEPIPAGSCLRETDEFKGSSGFRLVPGNTCDVNKGIKKDAQVMKPCKAGTETPGMISHQTVSTIVLTRELQLMMGVAVYVPWTRTRSVVLWRVACESLVLCPPSLRY